MVSSWVMVKAAASSPNLQGTNSAFPQELKCETATHQQPYRRVEAVTHRCVVPFRRVDVFVCGLVCL